ncbi:hypothetical protein QTP88_007007 [Uroleucon formosanum]
MFNRISNHSRAFLVMVILSKMKTVRSNISKYNSLHKFYVVLIKWAMENLMAPFHCLYQLLNDDQHFQYPTDFQFENTEVNEHNYKKISATTVYKKLQVLEIRDKIIRASNTTLPIKEINADKIKPMEGTCQDMCPEKERLLRIHGNMVSQFKCKMIDLKLEPVFEMMVKQYARSSADQANPLSQELRLIPVLI